MQRICVGDLVQVISGDAKKKRGRVTRILRAKNRVLVQGLMMVHRHTKPTQKNAKGQIVDKESSIHISNVMPIDAVTDRVTRVGAVETKTTKERKSVKGNGLIHESGRSKKGE